MGITKKVLSSGLAACMLFGFGGSVLFPQQTLSHIEARTNPGEGTSWHGDKNYYCIFDGGHISWYVDLSSRVWNKDGSAAVLVDAIDNENNTIFRQTIYTFYDDGTYKTNTGSSGMLKHADHSVIVIYNTLNM